ncbi:MAG: hypothetical protein COA47_03140 [Robiginitomaculum sp.]|nr:MAG: hypothetical protein COA47_03140 [Robiginitomaculum sp.]
MTVDVEPKDVDDFVQDKTEWFAWKSGASKSQYLDWIETFGEPRCGAIMTKGTRCRNCVSGGLQRSFEIWLQEDGGLCQIHGGLSSNEARRF